jgi:putative acetyltransferase
VTNEPENTVVPPQLRVRAATSADRAAIDAVHASAFDSRAEPDLVAALVAANAVVLALVAELITPTNTAQVVGHILFTPVRIASVPRYTHAVTLAPLGVLPTWQRHGIGTRLVQAGLGQCRRNGYTLVAVIGDPAYYTRFGFVAAHPYGLHCGFVAPDSPACMVNELQPGALSGKHGLIRFHPAFEDMAE